jgi:cellulose synthase/poly-beta-1,6-N-acetylglucosamine synthase-like glycosyltransferase
MKDIMMFLTIIPIVVMVVMLIVNTLFAIGVSNEAAKLRRAQIPLYAFDGSTWCFVVFCTGILGFLTFWLIHYSALNGHQSLRK